MLNDLFVRSVRLSGELPEDSYLNRLPVIKNLRQMGELSLQKRVTFLVGENGIGKSTLIEAIAVNMGFNPEGGTINFNFATESSHSVLHEYIAVDKGAVRHTDGFFLRAESFYNVASHIDRLDREMSFGPPLINSYGGVSLHEQSHGESFMALVRNRFGGNGLYILDEPEAALSPSRILQLMCYIDMLVRDNSQFIISTHSPILMAYPDAEVLWLTDDAISAVPYQETEHYQLTKLFMDSPERMFRYLFDEE